MFLGNRTLWKRVSWPVLFLTAFHLVYFPHMDGAVRAWANQPLPSVDSAPVEVNWGELPQPGLPKPALLRKAAELENHPVLIYEFVRNQVEYEPYSGVRFGALGTLERLRGNDADQSLLLVALLRAAWRNMGRPDPELSIVKGSVRLTGEQALAVFGLETRAAITPYLNQAGVKHRIVGSTAQGRFELILEEHVWVRGDLEYGHLRGARFAEGGESARVELDPSFVIQEETAPIPEPAQISGVRADEFVSQVLGFLTKSPESGSVTKVPEAFFLAQADSAAAVFRRFLEQENLTAEQALARRRPTVERIDTLPEALPWNLESRPVATAVASTLLGGWSGFDAALEPMRHHVQVRVSLPSGATLTEATLAASSLYRQSLTIDFTTSDALTTSTLAAPSLAAGTLGALPLTPRVQLLAPDGPATEDAVVGTQPTATVPYGTPIRIQIALAGRGSVAPLEDPSAVRDVLDTRAGGVYALAAIPSLNTGSATDFRTRYQRLASGASSGEATAARGAGLPLDLVAQALLAQNEELLRLGAFAGGHRSTSQNEWALAGLEPVLAKDDQGADVYAPLRYVFAVREGAIPLGATVASGNARLTDTAALQGVLQLTREALLASIPSLALGEAVQPATAGRLTREANALELPLYSVGRANADVLDVPGDRFPATPGTLPANLQSNADAGASLLLPSGRLTTTQGGTEDSLAGMDLWGYTQRNPRGVWTSQVRLADGTLRRAASEQQTQGIPSFLLGPAALLGSTPELTPAYRRLADLSISGVEAWEGARVATAQAFVAALHPLAQLLGPSQSGPAQDVAARTGSTTVFLHALLDEFSRPEVLGLELEVVQDGVVRMVAPGEVFNPALCTRVIARGAFNQTLETFQWVALDGAGVPRGRFPQVGQDSPELDVRQTAWLLKNTVASQDFPEVVDTFEWMLDYYGSADLYSGPMELRLDGALAGRRSRQKASRFIIDAKAPTASIVGWDPARAHRGDLSVIGTADDLHFREYRLEIATGNGSAGPWELLQSASTPVLNGRLGEWPAGTLGRNGEFTFRLTARDRAGNESVPVMSTVRVQNDITPPVIDIARPAATSPVSGTLMLAMKAMDSGTANSGLRSFKAWLEYEERAPNYSVGPKTEVLIDAKPAGTPPEVLSFPELFATNSAITHSIETRRYQARRDSPLRLVVRAEDEFGLVSEQSRTWTINNLLFNCQLTRGTFTTQPTPGVGDQPTSTEVRVFQSVATPPIVTVKRTGSGEAGAALVRSYGPINVDSAGTTFFAFRFDSSTPVPGGVSQGAYTISVVQGAERQELPVVVYNGVAPSGSLESPLVSILLKDVAMPDEAESPQGPATPGKIRLRGVVECDALAFNNGLPDSTPLGALSPAPRPYWHLAYKPHDSSPKLEVAGVRSSAENSFNASTLAGEENWIEIARGYSEIPAPSIANPRPVDFAVLKEWDVTQVPTGTYDIRLIVADGMSLYAKAVVPGVQVTSAALIPGEDPDSRDPGALTVRQVDMTVNFEGFPVEVARSYSSFKASIKGDFGFGWDLEGLGGTLNKSSTVRPGLGDEAITVDLKLPDGRAFTYTNNPLSTAQLQSGFSTKSAWHKERAFNNRPYGQMLWLPGYRTPFDTILDLGGVFGQTSITSEGWVQVQQYLNSLSPIVKARHGFGNEPDGKIAVLKTEEGNFLFYEWKSGRLLRQDRGDVSPDTRRRIEFSYTLDAQGNDDEVTISDHLGRSIRIERNDDGTIRRVVDPRGFATEYSYTQGRLTEITTRNGEKRWLKYEQPGFPNYLTSMVVDSQEKNTSGFGVLDDNDARIAYEYDSQGRLGGVAAGGGGVRVDYLENSDGSGTQILVDRKTGARSEIVHDNAGRVLRQTDASGVTKTFAYTSAPPANPPPGVIPPPEGILAAETANGLTTEYDYDLDQYNQRPTGIEGIANGLVSFWLNRSSGGAITDDYPYAPSHPDQLPPGYLTNLQIQPEQTKTPAVGPDGVDRGEKNIVRLKLDEVGLPPGKLPSGNGRSYGLTDMEGRDINLGYGDNGTGQGNGRNGVGAIQSASQDTQTKTIYVESGRFVGRMAERRTHRNGNLVSVTRYTYSDGTIDPTFPELKAAMVAAIPDLNDYYGGDIIDGVRKGFTSLWVEKQVASRARSEAGTPSTSTAYLDATGNTLATMDSEGNWTFTIYDAEERSVVSVSKTGDRQYSVYNAAGAVVRSRSVTEDSDTTVAYVYDAEGRLKETLLPEGEKTQIVYGEESGLRSLTNIDENGNTNVSLTDAAGRVVEERQITREGATLSTRMEYDSNGRVHRVTNPRGLVTEVEYDDAGREREVTQIAEGVRSTSRRGYDRFGRLAWSQTPLQIAAGRATTYLYKVDRTDAAAPPEDVSTPWTTLDDVASLDDPSYGKIVAVFHEDDVQSGPNGPWSDPTNNASYFTEGTRFWESYEYDSRGRQTVIARPVYRTPGQPATVVKSKVYFLDDGSPNANQAKYIVFNWNEATWTETFPHGLSGDTNVTFAFEYDDDGERSKVRYPSGLEKEWIAAEDAEGNPTSYLETQAAPPGVRTTRRQTVYQAGGRPDYVSDAVGNRIDQVYGTKRLDARVLRNAQGLAAFTHRYTWQEDGSLSTVETYRGEATALEDLLRRETRITDLETGTLRQVSKTEGTIDYQHDRFNAIKSVSYFGETTEYKYDNFGRLGSVRSRAGDWNYSYNALGQKDRVENLRTGDVELREYDALGRLTRIRHTNASGAIIFEAEYLLGIDGTRRGVIERRGATATTVTFEYDALGRMVREVRAEGAYPNPTAIPAAARMLDVAYTLDADGNRLTETNGLLTGPAARRDYIYETASGIRTQRLLRIERQGVAEETYTWTANGELQTRTYATGRSESYSWNPDGTLGGAAFGGENHDLAGWTVGYLYDADGALVRRTVRNATGVLQSDERYLVDSGENPTGRSQILATIDAVTGQVAELAIWADELKATAPGDGGAPQTVATDALGSIRVHGTTTYDYSAFGTPLSAQPGNPAQADWAFAGELRDAATGFQNHRARWLDPGTGTWLSTDPEFDFPAGFGHERLYAGAAPMTYTDPMGTFSLLETGISGAIQAAIRSYVGYEIRSFILKALLSTVGIEPSRLLGPFIDAIAESLGIDTLYPEVAAQLNQIFENSEAFISQTVPPEVLEVLQKIGFVIKVIQFAKEVGELMVELIRAMMSRSLANAVGLMADLIDVAEALYEFLATEDDDPIVEDVEDKAASRSKAQSKSRLRTMKLVSAKPENWEDSETQVMSFVQGWIEHRRQGSFETQAVFKDGKFLYSLQEGDYPPRGSTIPDGADFDSKKVVRQLFDVKRTTKLYTTAMVDARGGFVMKLIEQAKKRAKRSRAIDMPRSPRQVILFDLRHMVDIPTQMKTYTARTIAQKTRYIIRMRDVYFVTEKGIENYKGETPRDADLFGLN